MSATIYDLFKGNSQENAIWIEAVEGLEAATERMNRLAAMDSSDYFLFQSGNVDRIGKTPKIPRAKQTSSLERSSYFRPIKTEARIYLKS